MPIEPVAYIAGACVIFLAGLCTRELVEFVRGEIAFSRAVRGRLDAFAARWQEQTGQSWGPIGDVPEHMANPVWARDLSEPPDPGEYEPDPSGDECPDDEDAHPRDEQRMQAGAWRRETIRGDGNTAVWPTNLVEAAQASGIRQAVRQGGGRHSRALAEADTLRLNPVPIERPIGGAV